MRVAIQGTAGSFHHQAAKIWFGNDVTIVPAKTFTEAFGLLKDDQASVALLAIENSIHGPLTETLDCIASYRFPIVGEIYLHIHQQLIGLKDAPLEGIRYVYSQPVALAQCSHYMAARLPYATPVDYHDTTASVRYVKEQNDPTIAAVAGIDAAKEYGLSVLDADIEDNAQNYTRFLVIDPQGKPAENANKTSLILTTDHTPGALARALGQFAQAAINVTSLQSRPVIGDAWHYRFHLDVEACGAHLQDAVSEIKKDGANVTVLGEYHQGSTH